jgi:hypothetical protein
MRLEQQYLTIPKTSSEKPRNDGERTVVENLTFGQAIMVIERFCKQLDNFHHYNINQSPSIRRRISIPVFCYDENREVKRDEPKPEMAEERLVLPYVKCIFTLKDNEKHKEWCDKEDFNVENIA